MTDMPPAPIVERYTVTGDIAYPIHEDTNGEYVRHSDYAALLHQLAEREAEVERLERLEANARKDCEDWYRRYEYQREKLEAAERAREESTGLLRDLRRAYVRLLESGRDRIIELGGQCDPVDVMERGDIDLRNVAAFLAASRGKVDG